MFRFVIAFSADEYVPFSRTLIVWTHTITHNRDKMVLEKIGSVKTVHEKIHGCTDRACKDICGLKDSMLKRGHTKL